LVGIGHGDGRSAVIGVDEVGIIGIEFCDWRAGLAFVKVQVLGADLAIGVDFGDELVLLMRCCRLLLQ